MAALMAGFETIGRQLVPLAWTLAWPFGAGAGHCLYVRHARRHPHPILDFSLLRIPTFASSVMAGSLFRIAVGAMPFLLPLMLQLSFGKSPMQSGLVTFASAAGAILMKPAAQPLLRRFGFRAVLVVNGVMAVGVDSICAAFQPSWPSLVLDVDPVRQRVFPLAAIHRLQHHRLWRRFARPHVRRHHALHHHPAAHAHARHRRRRRNAGDLGASCTTMRRR